VFLSININVLHSHLKAVQMIEYPLIHIKVERSIGRNMLIYERCSRLYLCLRGTV